MKNRQKKLAEAHVFDEFLFIPYGITEETRTTVDSEMDRGRSRHECFLQACLSENSS